MSSRCKNARLANGLIWPEAGVRNLERQIGAVCRKMAVQIAAHETAPVTMTPERVQAYLKQERLISEVSEPHEIPGIATGLAVTAVGDDILFIEATRMKGKGGLTLTGHLGEVMSANCLIAPTRRRTKAGHPADKRYNLLGKRRRDTMDGHVSQTEWVDFFDGLSKTHEGDEAQLHIIGRAFGNQEEAAWMPLAGISYDPHHHQLFISVGGMSGRYPAHLTHMIDGPRQVHVRYNDEGEVSSLIIVAPDKTETHVRLRRLPQPAA